MNKRIILLCQLISFALIALLLAIAAAPAAAGNQVADGAVAVAPDGDCSLIEAIDNANDTSDGLIHVDCAAGNPAGADTITLPEDGSFTLTASAVTANGAGNGLPLITSAVTIAGNGATIERDPTAPKFRILSVAAAGNLALNELTLRGGDVSGAPGSEEPGASGGAVFNAGALTLDRNTLTGNVSAAGGALFNTGTVSIRSSTIDSNRAGENSNIFRRGDGGGGVFNATGATLEMTNSTLAGNSIGYVQGGGLRNAGLTTLTHVTVVYNTPAQGGFPLPLVNTGGIHNDASGTLILHRNLISLNFAVLDFDTKIFRDIANFGGVVVADDYNHFGAIGSPNVVGFTPGPTDFTPGGEVGLNVAELADYGGPTRTVALRIGSPAIDAAPTDGCQIAPLDVDQRGEPRVKDGDRQASDHECDVGSYDAQGEIVVMRTRLQEENVWADWAYTDEAGVTTVVTVIASEWAMNPDSGLLEPILVVSAIQVDAEFIPIMIIDGVNSPFGAEQSPFELAVHDGLLGARVVEHVLAAEVISQGDVTVEIDLTWTSTSKLMVFNDNQHYREEGGVHTFFRFHGKAREAVATGSVIVNGVNLTPMPSSSAMIQKLRDGSMLITRE